MSIQAVLFDLDGTLADTALDLGGALNTLLRRHGLPEKSMEEVRPVASHGANGLVFLGAGISCGHPDHAQWRAPVCGWSPALLGRRLGCTTHSRR